METQSENTPNGGCWAAVLAAGIGCAAIGLFTDLAEGSKSISAALTLSKPVGNLSGKTTFGIACWLLVWGILHLRWRRRDLASPGKVATLTAIFILLAMIAVFPPFFGLFSRR
jgi:hypothetical protein